MADVTGLDWCRPTSTEAHRPYMGCMRCRWSDQGAAHLARGQGTCCRLLDFLCSACTSRVARSTMCQGRACSRSLQCAYETSFIQRMTVHMTTTKPGTGSARSQLHPPRWGPGVHDEEPIQAQCVHNLVDRALPDGSRHRSAEVRGPHKQLTAALTAAAPAGPLLGHAMTCNPLGCCMLCE